MLYVFQPYKEKTKLYAGVYVGYKPRQWNLQDFFSHENLN